MLEMNCWWNTQENCWGFCARRNYWRDMLEVMSGGKHRETIEVKILEESCWKEYVCCSCSCFT